MVVLRRKQRRREGEGEEEGGGTHGVLLAREARGRWVAAQFRWRQEWTQARRRRVASGVHLFVPWPALFRAGARPRYRSQPSVTSVQFTKRVMMSAFVKSMKKAPTRGTTRKAR